MPISFAHPEGTALWINRGAMDIPEINRNRATFVLGRIDEILSWDRAKEQEKDTRFVELGVYLCEVRAKQYWRLENLNLMLRYVGGCSWMVMT
jgi:hypothetical protein